MHFPVLKPGQRFQINRPLSATSSADSAYLSRFALHKKELGKRIVVIVANAQDAQRLKDELMLLAPELHTSLFADWETLPYDPFSPHQDLISDRVLTLWKIIQDQIDIIIVAATTALYYLAPPAFLAAHTFLLKQKQKLDEKGLKHQLTFAGYEHVENVIRPGEYAIRGGLIDFFPMGSTVPYRIDLFDDEIDSIRAFDPDTQRSLYPVTEVRLLPAKEFPLDTKARMVFQSRWSSVMPKGSQTSMIYKDIDMGIPGAGIEYYLPLFFETAATLFDYLHPEKDTLIFHGDIGQSILQFWVDTRERFKLAGTDPDRPGLEPKYLFLTQEDFYLHANRYEQLAIRDHTVEKETKSNRFFTRLPEIQSKRGSENPLQALQAYISQGNRPILMVASSPGRREVLRDLLHSIEVYPEDIDSLKAFQQKKACLGLIVGFLANGFSWLDEGLDLITETELFAGQVQVKRRIQRETSATNLDTLIQDLSELQIGDPIVHSEHGIGRYRGLKYLEVGHHAQEQEFVHLEYANQALLYVPVEQLHLISRYTGVNAEEAPLHRLGSGQWEKAKSKAAQQVRDTAAELLNIYASRALRQGYAFRFNHTEYETFARDFRFEETPDQCAAIHRVIQDLISPQPMDRLVCGDVGFGKTEVALRAAFVVAMQGKQVAILAPTTLLCEQHYQTVTERFAKWPIKVSEMSRFRSTKEIQQASIGLADGSIDVVVGTHKLLSSNIKFKDLGLLIIDEEHRFGVRHKEKMKALRAEVDILTLTATPIPRTMGMALEGLRDLSVIATPPQKRLAVKTFVRTESHSVIREAVLREIKRGGQCYFLHNEVETIENRYDKLVALLPEARITIAHGQMPERLLESVMRDFVAQRFNVLLCSTIIETGIDVPNANTILITRADKFGLAQLHQLRGRVGRSHHQAYAYLMVGDIAGLSKTAKQRLDAITQMEDLGSGFYLAMHDLEIRGAGEILGDKQSGNMIGVGFQLYNDMLSKAVHDLKGGKEPELLNLHPVQTDIKLYAPALLPKEYCPDVHLRLSFYKKLATTKNVEQIARLQEELADRFGALPTEANNLLDTHRLRILAQSSGIQRIDAKPTGIVLSFHEQTSIDPTRIIKLVQENRHIGFAGNNKLHIKKELAKVPSRVQEIQKVFSKL